MAALQEGSGLGLPAREARRREKRESRRSLTPLLLSRSAGETARVLTVRPRTTVIHGANVSPDGTPHGTPGDGGSVTRLSCLGFRRLRRSRHAPVSADPGSKRSRRRPPVATGIAAEATDAAG